jgi:hypothetical protein
MKRLDIVSQTLPNPAEIFYLPHLQTCFYLTTMFARGRHIFEQLQHVLFGGCEDLNVEHI